VRSERIAAAICIAFLATAASIADARQASTGRLLDGAAWLAGEWVLVEGDRCTEEHWTKPSSNMMIGTSRSVRAGRTTSFEFMRIEARPDGVFFVAQPSGHPPVDFKLAAAAGPELVFLNPGHADHLSRVVYRRIDAEAMTGRIEGADAGKTFAVDYPYRRAKGQNGCE
jgi:Domain of unknown function (DUF6265)